MLTMYKKITRCIMLTCNSNSDVTRLYETDLVIQGCISREEKKKKKKKEADGI